MKWSLVAALALALAFPVVAQEASPSPEPSRRDTGATWRAELPGGIYTVALRSMVSVSRHEYVVDGAARVTEVNVDTVGSVAVRFYFIEPNAPKAPLGIGQSAIDKAQSLLQEAGDRTGADEVWKRVVKSYPATTHSRTVEYRLASLADLEKVFESADEALRLGRPARIRIE